MIECIASIWDKIVGEGRKNMPETNPYRELYERFRESLKGISGEGLRQAVQAERSSYTVFGQNDLFCRAAIRCLSENGSRSGAKNIRDTFFRNDRFNEVFSGALTRFLRQFDLAAGRTGAFSVEQYGQIAKFFGHQAEFAVRDNAGGGVYISVLQELLEEWWRKSRDSFNASDVTSCLNWFAENLCAYDLAAELSESAKLDFGEKLQLPLPPPGVGKVLKDAIIINRIRDTVIKEDNLGGGSVVNPLFADRTRIENAYFSSTSTLWRGGDDGSAVNIELAMDVLLSSDAPFAQWEVACAAAGLVEFKWEQRTANV